MPPNFPKSPKISRQPQANLAALALLDRAVQRRAKVIVLSFQAAQPGGLIRPCQLWFCFLRQGQEVVPVCDAPLLALSALVQPLTRVLAHLFRQLIATIAD